MERGGARMERGLHRGFVMRTLVTLAVAALAGTAAAQSLELTEPLATVDFASGSAGVGDDASTGLRDAVVWLNQHPNRLLVIQGYADRAGSRTQNLRLSQDRADRVRAELLALGADPLRIIEVAYGEEDARPGRRVDVRGTLVQFPNIVRGQKVGVLPATRP
jgi:outer membrane protein OmpA-like peptidoglycan-associated protein